MHTIHICIKFDYRVVLCNAHHPKVKNQIQLDMSRTVVNSDENKEEIEIGRASCRERV